MKIPSNHDNLSLLSIIAVVIINLVPMGTIPT